MYNNTFILYYNTGILKEFIEIKRNILTQNMMYFEVPVLDL